MGDPRMVQARERTCLALEARASVCVLEEFFRQHLQCDRSVDARILRPVDLSHPAGAERRKDLVGAETSADAYCHEGNEILSVRELPHRPPILGAASGVAGEARGPRLPTPAARALKRSPVPRLARTRGCRA